MHFSTNLAEVAQIPGAHFTNPADRSGIREPPYPSAAYLATSLCWSPCRCTHSARLGSCIIELGEMALSRDLPGGGVLMASLTEQRAADDDVIDTTADMMTQSVTR